jgi:hypothetical protein
MNERNFIYKSFQIINEWIITIWIVMWWDETEIREDEVTRQIRDEIKYK